MSSGFKTADRRGHDLTFQQIVSAGLGDTLGDRVGDTVKNIMAAPQTNTDQKLLSYFSQSGLFKVARLSKLNDSHRLDISHAEVG